MTSSPGREQVVLEKIREAADIKGVTVGYVSNVTSGETALFDRLMQGGSISPSRCSRVLAKLDEMLAANASDADAA